MQYPLKIGRLEIRRKPIRYIIIHHTWCQYPIPQLELDSKEYQGQKLFNQVMEQKTVDLNYHAVITRTRQEYIALLGRPFVATCDFPDIDPQYNLRALHVALLGNYNEDMPDKRAYEIMAFRAINPFIRLLGLNPSRIFLHKNLSNNEEETCPGEFFADNVLITFMRRFQMK